jgi:5-methylcytosine-specific restriction protein B
MDSKTEETRSCWFVGAAYGGTDDQVPRFLAEGIWENNWENNNRLFNEVKAIQPGDRIAIKSSYIRKRDLPFDNQDQVVSVMAIKAVGKVIENMGDGHKLRVEWTHTDSPREWYFFTHRGTIWHVSPTDWMREELIDFTFNGKPQDIDRFRNSPYWRERFGDNANDKRRFRWTKYYEEFADKLLAFRNNRAALIAGVHEIAKRIDGISSLQDRYSDGTMGNLKDICPFTTIGIFNRGISDDHRKIIANELGKFLGVEETIPSSFEAIPVLHNQSSWFFSFEKDRQSNDIEALWEVFAAALKFADKEDPETRSLFIKAYDDVNGRRGIGWNLSFGLYWIRPWTFPTLDKKSRYYLDNKLKIQIDLNGHKKRCNGTDYLKVLETVEARFQEEEYPVHSFPELSLEAHKYYGKADQNARLNNNVDQTGQDEEDDADLEVDVVSTPVVFYSVEDILAEGSFIGRPELEMMLKRLRTKRNIILQGPPGTGKTWLAKRLAFALIGQRDETKIRAVQFHPNLSYEDFIRGWRPSGEGRLSLTDGPFMEAIKAALKEPSVPFVVVIEEINRGNPARIFGEMLTLLEADKRTPSEALELCYRYTDNERIFIPDNLYVIGTMNIADRSLALVDMAFRRRFAFLQLEPMLGEAWREWVSKQNGFDPAILDEIAKRIRQVNENIAADSRLGRQFLIGHSFVTPPRKTPITDAREWFKQVVESEIGPLLEEYWFDDPQKAKEVKLRLIEGL